MLNGDLKKEAITKLEESIERNSRLVKIVQDKAANLFVLRQRSSEQIIGEVQNYVNTLTNTPKEFDKSFSEYHVVFEVFTEMLNAIRFKGTEIDSDFGTTATAGVLAGVGTAALAPTAAMAVATTFGAASTGTAIASLGGAAATNAALAWLGGGALVAGGGGMAGGSALLALAGPIGWAIGGAAVVGGGLIARSKNEELAKEANQKRKKVEIETAQLKASEVEVNSLLTITNQHINGVSTIFSKLHNNTPNNYQSFSSEQKSDLVALVNHIQSLSKLLNKKVK
jgi:hypothetical protein